MRSNKKLVIFLLTVGLSILFTQMYTSEIMIGIIFLSLVSLLVVYLGVRMFFTSRKSFIFALYLFGGVGMFTLSPVSLFELGLLGMAWSIGLIVILHISFDFHLSKINISSVILNTFIWGGFLCCFSNYKILLSNPFFIEDLGSFSSYKYSFLFFVSIIVLIRVLIHYFFKYKKPVTMKTPELPWYLDLAKISEECFIFIFFGKYETFDLYCWSFVHSLLDKKKLKKVLIIHFLFFQGLNAIQLTFFFKFIFLHGDLRYILILLPLTMLKYILSLLESYLKKHLEFFCEELCSLIKVNIKAESKFAEKYIIINPSKLNFKFAEKYIIINPSKLNFKLTPKAIANGYTKDVSLPELSDMWLKACYLACTVERNKDMESIFLHIVFLIQIFFFQQIL